MIKKILFIFFKAVETLQNIPLRNPLENCHDWLVSSTMNVTQISENSTLSFDSASLMPSRQKDSMINSMNDSTNFNHSNDNQSYLKVNKFINFHLI